ncbi:MAG TPA: hypothetical protein VLV83_07325 [Acidobacteriota bacterium]|nr:hypothetical protein [Acidobacteriota bacterium]
MNTRNSTSAQGGFVLISVLLLLFLASVLAAAIHFQVRLLWRQAVQSEARLHSQLMAENGIEYARAVLPGLDPVRLLAGADGAPCRAGESQRMPLSLAEARQIDPSQWSPGCDDGLPPGYRGSDQAPEALRGYYALRFFNNPEEPPQEDRDGVLVVRSLGIAPLRLRHPMLPTVRNSLTLAEARLRRERALALDSALTVFAESGLFVWRGEQFLVDGGESAGISWFSQRGSRIATDLADSLAGSQADRVVGSEESPSIHDARLDWLQSQQARRRLLPGFWEGFLQRLPQFNQWPQGPLALLEDPPAGELRFQGLLVLRGDVVLEEDSLIRGLVLHLGQGRLSLEDRSEIQGALWMSNLDTRTDPLRAGPVHLEMADNSRLVYDRGAVEEALAAMPPTQLQWRIIFPEMSP